MSDMVEIDIDFDYCGEVEMILAHDECGEHADVEFYRNDLLAAENAKLRELVAHLMYVKPNDVNAILYKGKLLRFDDLLAEVGMRWESEVD